MSELVRAARPAQWIKNLVVFAGLLFANELGSGEAWLRALGCFAVFCAASSAAYLVNDVRDAEHDREHPVKRDRPVASGALAPRAALVAAAALAVLALAVAVALGAPVVGLLAVFAGLQLAYSLGLKHVVALDVLVIAALFVVRAAAGAAAVDVEISTWLLVCTALLALLLGLAKRRGELALVGADEAPGRPVLDGYSTAWVERALAAVAAATLLAYGAYTFVGGAAGMPLTIPFVAFGLARYLRLVHTHGRGEQPDRVLLEDRPLQVSIVLWVAVAALLVVRDG